jgi:hypothetical protein
MREIIDQGRGLARTLVAKLGLQVIGSDYLFLNGKMSGTRQRRRALLEQRGYGGEMWLARAAITFAAALGLIF